MTHTVVLTPLRLEAVAVRRGLPEAQVVRTGMGRERSLDAVARRRGLANGAVAVAGVAGAVEPTLRPGDVVIATEVRSEDGRVRRCPSAALLATAVRARGVRVVSGPVLSADRLIGAAERERLCADGIVAVDMESAWLAETAGEHPLAVLRVVADEPGRRLLDPRMLVAGTRALTALYRVAPALAVWARATGPRTVLLAGPRSFCAGVERAIEIVERALEQRGAPIYVRKQIVHNVHVVSELEERGAVFVAELDDVPDGATVVFSAHGVSPQVKATAAERGLDVIDATCPLVNKVHAEARTYARMGKTIVLVGHDGHEEVEGTMGEAPDVIRLVETVDDLDRLEIDDPEQVAYLTQTTLSVDDTAHVVDALRERFPALAGPRSADICYATSNRQEALKAVARESDLVLVVGSVNSSNSVRLVEVSQKEGTPAYLIDDESDLDPAWLHGARTIGLTAGASAPERLVRRVIDELAGLGPVQVEDRTVASESIQFNLPKEVV
ncbi:MAG: 4-hydroxy-3-methylbut-2-enyl diphosphate reductase [Gaiellaceae bacterium]